MRGRAGMTKSKGGEGGREAGVGEGKVCKVGEDGVVGEGD